MDIASVVRACQSGDRDALGVLYRVYSLPMKEVIGCYVHDRDAVCDILHDGFIIAFSSIGTLRDSSKIQHWLTIIMKNLSLQYLKKEALRNDITISDSLMPTEESDDLSESELTLDLLEDFIGRLPKGYNSVFRLSVLKGLSHKEVSAILGITPQTSASQLFHAKAMLRKMIRKYRFGIGMCMIVVSVSLTTWLLISKRHVQVSSQTVTSPSIMAKEQTVKLPDKSEQSVNSVPGKIDKCDLPSGRMVVENIVKNSVSVDSAGKVCADSLAVDTLLPVKPIAVPLSVDRLRDVEHIASSGLSTCEDVWAVSLSYSGNSPQKSYGRYRLPDASSADGDMEETRRYRYYPTFSVEFSVNRKLNNDWSIGCGLRYSCFRTDIMAENKYSQKESVIRAHYIGIPLKVNRRIFDIGKISIYGQYGLAVDIPLDAEMSTTEYFSDLSDPSVYKAAYDAPLRWSAEGGLGFRFRVSRSLSIYAEPSFKYYFNSTGRDGMMLRARPIEMTLPVGVSVTW